MVGCVPGGAPKKGTDCCEYFLSVVNCGRLGLFMVVSVIADGDTGDLSAMIDTIMNKLNVPRGTLS